MYSRRMSLNRVGCRGRRAASRDASAEVSPSAHNDILQIYISKWRARSRIRAALHPRKYLPSIS